jgi:hypothetical protein
MARSNSQGFLILFVVGAGLLVFYRWEVAQARELIRTHEVGDLMDADNTECLWLRRNHYIAQETSCSKNESQVRLLKKAP